MTIPQRKTRKSSSSNRPTHTTLRKVTKVFTYDPSTGEILRHTGKSPIVMSDLPLRSGGSTPTVVVNGQKLALVSIAWYLQHRYYPHKTPRFINNNKRDYRLENLRYAY